MKIISIIENDDTLLSGRPRICVLPDSSIIRTGKPFFIPEFSGKVRGVATMAVRIDRLGKGIAGKFAGRYYTQAAPAVVLVAPNPFPFAVGTDGATSLFDGSFWLGEYVDIDRLRGCKIDFSIDGIGLTASISADDMLVKMPEILSGISHYNTMKIGDIITPAGSPSFELNPDMRVRACIDGVEMLDIHVK